MARTAQAVILCMEFILLALFYDIPPSGRRSVSSYSIVDLRGVVARDLLRELGQISEWFRRSWWSILSGRCFVKRFCSVRSKRIQRVNTYVSSFLGFKQIHLRGGRWRILFLCKNFFIIDRRFWCNFTCSSFHACCAVIHACLLIS